MTEAVKLWTATKDRLPEDGLIDDPVGLAKSIAEGIRLGTAATTIRDAILGERDRGEHWWQFRRRVIEGDRNGSTNGQKDRRYRGPLRG